MLTPTDSRVSIPRGTRPVSPPVSGDSRTLQHSPSSISDPRETAAKMMVPRAYLNRSAPSGLRGPYNEKQNVETTRSSPGPSALSPRASDTQLHSRAAAASSSTSPSSPVRIPQTAQKALPSASSAAAPGSNSRSRGRDIPQVNRTKSASAASAASAVSVESLLSSTTIPPRRKPRGRRSQKLPEGDYVADFSKLLLEDVAARDLRSPTGSFGFSQFEELFGHSAEKGTPSKIAPESVHPDTPLSVRSMSTESMPSLVVDDDPAETALGDMSSPPPSTQRCSPERRARLLSTSEDCGDDHPLQHVMVLEPLSPILGDMMDLAIPSKNLPNHKSRTSSLRSNLTASLRALKSAAQTVSSLASTPPATRPDDFLTRSIFSFAPELTDDKRPPPSDHPPSPALRRYLNPHPPPPEPGSPAELHSYSEYPTRRKPSRRKGRRSPSPPPPTTSMSVQLQTCIPSAIRSSNASSPPIWLGADGTPTTHPDLPSPSSSSSSSFAGRNLARQREPRENPAFLRILVAEMNMRKSGKFDEGMESHACVWLPPRKGVEGQTMRSGRERWSVYSAP